MNTNSHMNIMSFMSSENDTQLDMDTAKYNTTLFKLFKREYIDSRDFGYFNDFQKNGPSICGIEFFMNKVNNMHNVKANCKKIQTDENKIEDEKILTEFKKATCDLFSTFFKYDEDMKMIRINKNISYYMSRLETITFNGEQKDALKKLYAFLINNDKYTFGLYGYAGSGKTTTIVEFISYLLENKFIKSVAFTAPTNQAIIVIKNKFKMHLKRLTEKICEKELPSEFNFDDELDSLEQRGVLIKFMSVHKLLKFQSDYSIDGDMIFVRDVKGGSLISQFELVVIDECSMINIDMVDSVFNEVRSTLAENKSSKSYKNIPKIIFTGDPAQLPPVHEVDSSIFCKSEDDLSFDDYKKTMEFKASSVITSNSLNDLKYKYDILIGELSRMDTFLLKNIVRSRIGIVTKVCHEMRNWIHSDKLPKLEKFNTYEGAYFFDNTKTPVKTKSEWFKKFISCTMKGDSCIILTWTNKQTDLYNQTIRSTLFKSNNINKFEVGDILILSEFYSLDLGEDFVKQKLHTSEQIRVIDTKKSKIPMKMFETITNAFIKKMKQNVKVEGMLKMLIDGLNDKYCKNISLNCWVLVVKKNGETDENHRMSIIVIDDCDFDSHKNMKNECAIAIKNFSRQLLHIYRATSKQVERNIIKPLWKQWNKVFVEQYANVNYGYSITCHKAQGSSLYDVYVDLDDILLNTERTVEAKKCAYTAVTRVSNELNILI